jgi:hypothetical protein
MLAKIIYISTNNDANNLTEYPEVKVLEHQTASLILGIKKSDPSCVGMTMALLANL